MIFIQLLLSDPAFYLIWVVLVVFSICCHEYAHALAAKWNGDNTAAINGHLTLNPFKQMGITSLISLLLVGIGWGMVPVNNKNMRHKYSPSVVAFAGPLMNIILFFIFAFVAALVFSKNGNNQAGPLLQFFMVGSVLNAVLFVFNLIPVPPLDGWTIISILHPKIHMINQELRNGIMVGIFIIVLLYFNVIFKIGDYLTIHTVNIFLTFL